MLRESIPKNKRFYLSSRPWGMPRSRTLNRPFRDLLRERMRSFLYCSDT